MIVRPQRLESNPEQTPRRYGPYLGGTAGLIALTALFCGRVENLFPPKSLAESSTPLPLSTSALPKVVTKAPVVEDDSEPSVHPAIMAYDGWAGQDQDELIADCARSMVPDLRCVQHPSSTFESGVSLCYSLEMGTSVTIRSEEIVPSEGADPAEFPWGQKRFVISRDWDGVENDYETDPAPRFQLESERAAMQEACGHVKNVLMDNRVEAERLTLLDREVTAWFQGVYTAVDEMSGGEEPVEVLNDYGSSVFQISSVDSELDLHFTMVVAPTFSTECVDGSEFCLVPTLSPWTDDREEVEDVSILSDAILDAREEAYDKSL
jgi:hypothetical protein